MVRLYADEDFSLHVVEILRQRGYDVETPFDHNQARKGVPDDTVLAFAISLERAVITHNREDFKRLHRQYQRSKKHHCGIITCTRNPSDTALVACIDAVVMKEKATSATLENRLLLVYKGSAGE